jgi:hypothetical protein
MSRIKNIFVAAVVMSLLVSIGTLRAQSPRLAFEVATIKPSRPEEQRSVVIRGRRFTTTAYTFWIVRYWRD